MGLRVVRERPGLDVSTYTFASLDKEERKSIAGAVAPKSKLIFTIPCQRSKGIASYRVHKWYN